MAGEQGIGVIENEAPDEPRSTGVSKSDLVRDAVVFQVKLVIDGIRDFILIPVSLVATLISLLKSGDEAGREFYDVVAFGRDTEKKINLFSAAERIDVEEDKFDSPDLDSLVDQVEGYMRKEYEGERFTAARTRIEKMLASLDAKRQRRDGEDNV